MEAELFQIIYVSAASPAFDESTLPELLHQARTNNEKLGITGMLLYHEGSFIQVMTGPEEAVMAVYRKVEKDPRHCDPSLLFKGHVEERSFEDWSMGFYQTSARTKTEMPGLNMVLSVGFSGKDGELDRVRQVLDAFRDGRWRQAANG